jgi:hypothetical protein
MIRIVSFLIISLILSFPVSAQWQVDSGAIPVGKGPGKVGFGSVPAINVTIRAPTMAALRLIPASITFDVYLDGYYTAGDGGEGLFTWNGSSASSDDGGVVVNPTGHVGNGRRLRATYSSVPNIRWWGAVCNWNGSTGTDDSGTIQTAMNWAQNVLGAKIEVPRNVRCAIANTVAVDISNISLKGYSSSGTRHNVGSSTPDCSSQFVWTGAANGTMLFWTAQDGVAQRTLMGGGVEGLCLLGRGVAGIGLKVQSVRNGVFDQLYFDSFTNVSFVVGVNSNIANAEPCDSQLNRITNIFINNINPNFPGVAGTGFIGDSVADAGRPNNGCNFSINTMINWVVLTDSGRPILLQGTDNNHWMNIYGSCLSCTGGYGIDLSLSSAVISGNPYSTNSEYFFGIGMTMIARGTISFPGETPVKGIIVFGLDKGDGVPDPVMETGAQVSWYNSTGGVNKITNLSTGGGTPVVSACARKESLMTQDQVMGIVRWAIPFIGGMAVGKGWLTTAQVGELTNVVLALVGP